MSEPSDVIRVRLGDTSTLVCAGELEFDDS